MNMTTIGIDLAKNVFQVHAVNERGKVVLRKQLRRDQMATLSVHQRPWDIRPSMYTIHNTFLYGI